MKFRKSFFNGAVFRKNLTRFAPVWLLYTVCLLLGLVMLSDSGVEYWLSANIAQGISFMSIINFAFALLSALLLFGDLTNSKMCNGLHALPLRRETLFTTNVLSGMFFSLFPSAIMTVAAVIASFYSAVEQGWQIPLLWMLGTNLQYLFFFGLAAFCMMLSGNRIGASVIYCIINFAAYLAYFMADVVYVPHLPGVVAVPEPFLVYCPVAMMTNVTFIKTKQEKNFLSYNADGSEKYLLRGTFTLTEDWWYLWVCAAIGIILLILALLVYKKRKLECAGDLMATRKLEPVFLVLFSLVAGSLFQLVYVALNGYNAYGSSAFLWCGLVIGWFVGLMLLRRSSRVFSLKSFLGLAALAAALGLSLLINSMDLFGISSWVPKVEEVKSVTLRLSYMSSVTLDEDEDIETAIRLHTLASQARLGGEMGAVNTAVDLEEGDGTFIEIQYQLEDGSAAAREYFILIDSEAGDITRKFFSKIEAISDNLYYSLTAILSEEDLMDMLDTPERLVFASVPVPEELMTREHAKKLLEAILADSKAGNLVQHSAFHSDPVYRNESLDIQYWSYHMAINFPKGTIILDVYSDCAHILAWLEENGMIPLLHAQILENNGIG